MPNGTTTTESGAIVTTTDGAIELDVRPIIEAGGEPFDTIMAAVAELDDQTELAIIAPFEPVPLEGVLSEQGYLYEATELDGGDYRVRFWREA